MKLHNIAIAAAAAAFAGILPAGANSPYVSKVYEYRPAPGQFVNELPEYEEGDTEAQMVAKCEEYIVGQARGSLLSLGSFGGYIVFGFDHPIVNVPGEYDFNIFGNAFKGDPELGNGASAEPGIVMVSRDTNGNGIPDDEWFQLEGSEYWKSTTFHGCDITYSKPDMSRPVNADPDPDDRYITDRTYIHWTSNDPSKPQGYVMRNSYHTQSYWPLWIDGETISYNGITRLADNFTLGTYEGHSYYSQKPYGWGYADNQANDDCPGFKIDNAVDAQGNPVALSKIDFIKVYTALNQYCSWLGETSTEIMGAVDLHPDVSGVEGTSADEKAITFAGCSSSSLSLLNSGETVEAVIYSPSGSLCLQQPINSGYSTIDVSSLAPGIYLLRAAGATLKFAKP